MELNAGVKSEMNKVWILLYDNPEFVFGDVKQVEVYNSEELARQNIVHIWNRCNNEFYQISSIEELECQKTHRGEYFSQLGTGGIELFRTSVRY